MPTPATTLTVVLPVRNAEPYIGAALTSLLHNARADFEFVVVDDGSTDATGSIIDGFVDVLPGLQVVHHEHAVGLADARNIGLELATGRYVTYFDGDDWLARGYLADLVAAIDGLGVDFVRVDHVQDTARRRVLHRAPQARRGVALDAREGILPADRRTMVDYPYAWAGIYRRSLGDLLRFPAGLHTAEDRPWIWRLHCEAATYAVVPLAGLFYRRQVANSLTQTGDRRQLDVFDAFELVFDQLCREPQFQQKACRQFLAIVAHHLTQAGRLQPSLLGELQVRTRHALAELPRDQLLAAPMSPERGALLRPYLPADVRRVVPA